MTRAATSRESAVPTISKELADGYPQQQDDGTWVIRYNVTVTNSASLPAKYDLKDSFDFGEGIGISAPEVISAPVPYNLNWNGGGDTVLATNVTIPAATQQGPSTHVFVVQAKASVTEDDYESGATVCQPGDPNARRAASSTPPP